MVHQVMLNMLLNECPTGSTQLPAAAIAVFETVGVAASPSVTEEGSKEDVPSADDPKVIPYTNEPQVMPIESKRLRMEAPSTSRHRRFRNNQDRGYPDPSTKRT